MDKKRHRGYSDEEEEKENRMEKRLRRLEDAIFEIRDNKRHKKRRRKFMFPLCSRIFDTMHRYSFWPIWQKMAFDGHSFRH